MTDPTTIKADEPEEILHLFYCKRLSTHYHFLNGTSAAFVDGKYATKKQNEIKELQNEIAQGHPDFYIDPKKLTVTREQLEPDYELRQRIRKEEKEKLMANLDPARNMGNYDAKNAGAGTGTLTTANVGEAAVASGTAMAAELAGLAAKVAVPVVQSGPTGSKK